MPLIFGGLAVALGFVVHGVGILFRARLCTPAIPVKSPRYWLPLLASLAGDLLGGLGFLLLIQTAQPQETEYGDVLTVLSLLAAGVIAGKFAFSHQETAEDERALTAALSIIILFLFYSLFGAVSYYGGLSPDFRAAPMIEMIIPIIMVAVLFANTIHDYWDFLERDE